MEGCILSKFYIKPQRSDVAKSALAVVSYRNSTSNHNEIVAISIRRMLYLIEILHQTTTPKRSEATEAELYLIEILHQTTTISRTIPFCLSLYLIEILHQTTTRARLVLFPLGCILSKFYIKPQPDGPAAFVLSVVSYRNSTSNHN